VYKLLYGIDNPVLPVQEPDEIEHNRGKTDHMIYLRYVPSPPLDRYINYFYYLEGRMPYPCERILPVPLLDLKINLGGDFHLYEHCQTEQPRSLTESWLTGIQGMYHAVVWPSDMRLYGVCFKPTGVYPFLALPLAELYNQVVALDALWGRFASEFREQLSVAPSTEVGFALLERLLLARLGEGPDEQRLVEYGIAEIDRHHGSLSIKMLSDRIGVSQNHLRTHFKRLVGTSAKEMACLYRFEYVLHSTDPTQPVDWSQIAQQSGYYDQSHLNKDFMAFTGYSPTDYLHLRRRVYTTNAPVEQLSLRVLPTD
jgi:AraC-like DNA-binding protein